MNNNKYRAWYIPERIMFDVFGYDVNTVYPLQRSEDLKFPIPPDRSDCILLLYTNQHDMSNKEICQGDIIKGLAGQVMIVKFGEYNAYCPADHCEMNNVGFFVESKGYPQMPLGPTEEYAEIIGNIYQNPELLKIDMAARKI